MKRVCTLCQRISEDGNLWCQEYDCPAEDKPVVFSYGQFLGDVKVIRLLWVLRTAAFYEAERGGQPVLLKVAHQGRENHLRREAEILRQLQAAGGAPRKVFPTLLPAYRQSDTAHHPYARAIVEGETVYYEVFEHIEGEFLRDFLNKNPQPWYEHVAWVILSLADALAFLNGSLRRLHLMLIPEVVMIRTDAEGILRPVLLDLGLMISETQPEHLEWLHYYGMPAYTAPELTYTTPDGIARCLPATPSSEVYGLGILLYEMLAGHPVHEYRLQRDNQVRDAVRHHKPPPLTRRDLPDEIHMVIEQATAKSPRDRYPDVPSLARDLRRFFGEVPAEKTRRSGSQRWLIAVAVGAIILSALILLAALFG